MKLKPADIHRIMEENIPKPSGMRAAEDYAEENAQARDELIAGLIAQSSQSTARNGTVLPPPPKSLKTHIDGPNDFGAKVTTAIGESSSTGLSSSDTVSTGVEVALPVALRGGDLDQINSRADLMALLTQNLPLNELGLPKIIYRADLLDWKLFQGGSPSGTDPTERYRTMQQYLDCATLYLAYNEGFPALPTGEPLWARLPFEPEEHYSAFTDYCTIPGQRQVAKILKYPMDHVLQWFHEDYWSIRVKCYDMLNTIHAAKVREQRLLACEDSHYLKAEKLINKLEDHFAQLNWDSLHNDPKAYVDVLEKLVKLQRLALGQGSQANEKKELKSETIEVTMRKMAAPNLLEDKNGDGGIDVRQLLRNPDALASAQELIIKMSRHSSSQSSTAGDE
jgi:mannose/fructose/N-acetylgalactosamine-specific phosphotransferase system component IIB